MVKVLDAVVAIAAMLRPSRSHDVARVAILQVRVRRLGWRRVFGRPWYDAGLGESRSVQIVQHAG